MAEKTKDCKWELKVALHCEGCARKVKKVLQSVGGVYRVTVDSAKSKVTVEGESKLNPDVLVKKLTKIGKPAELLLEDQKRKSSDDEKTPVSSQKVGGDEEEKRKDTEDAADIKHEGEQADDGCSNTTSTSAFVCSSTVKTTVANGCSVSSEVMRDLSYPQPPDSVTMCPLNYPGLVNHYAVQYQPVIDPYAVHPYGSPGQLVHHAQMPQYAYAPPAYLRFNTDMFNDENTNSCTLM